MTRIYFNDGELVAALQVAIGAYRQRFNNPLINPLVDRWLSAPAKGKRANPEQAYMDASRAEVTALALALAQDFLDLHLNWVDASLATGEHRMHQVLSQLIPGWGEPSTVMAAAHFLRACVLDTAQSAKLETWVTQCVQGRGWGIWTIASSPNGLYLEEGEDYRVWDWTRRMQTQQWQANEAAESAPDDFEAANAASLHEAKQQTAHEFAAFANSAWGSPVAFVRNGKLLSVDPQYMGQLQELAEQWLRRE